MATDAHDELAIRIGELVTKLNAALVEAYEDRGTRIAIWIPHPPTMPWQIQYEVTRVTLTNADEKAQVAWKPYRLLRDGERVGFFVEEPAAESASDQPSKQGEA